METKKRKITRRVAALFNFCGLSFWLPPAIPESGDVDDVAFDEIDHLAQAAHNDATIGLGAVGEKWVN